MPPAIRLARIGALALGALAVAPVALGAGSAVAPGPENRRFTAGLEGWTTEGREPIALGLVGGRPRATLARNTSIVTPLTLVPANAQAFGILARAPRGRALVVVRALVEGAEPVRVGVLEPGGRLEEHVVGGLAPLAGATVRFELDPVTSLGRTVQIGGVGPFRAPLAGWSVQRGVPIPTRTRNRVEVEGDPLRATRGLRLPGDADAVTVRLRGTGTVQLTVAGRSRRLRADDQWRTLRVPVPAGARRAAVRLLARPGFRTLEIASPGAVRRAVQPS